MASLEFEEEKLAKGGSIKTIMGGLISAVRDTRHLFSARSPGLQPLSPVPRTDPVKSFQ